MLTFCTGYNVPTFFAIHKKAAHNGPPSGFDNPSKRKWNPYLPHRDQLDSSVALFLGIFSNDQHINGGKLWSEDNGLDHSNTNYLFKPFLLIYHKF